MEQSDPKSYLISGLRRVLTCGFIDFLGVFEFLGFEEVAKLSRKTLLVCFGRVIEKDYDIVNSMREAVVEVLDPGDFSKIILDIMLNMSREDSVKIDEMTLHLFEEAMQKNEDIRIHLCRVALDGRENVGCFLNDAQVEEMVGCMDQRKLLGMIQQSEMDSLFEESKAKETPSDSGLPSGNWTSSGSTGSSGGAPGNP